MSRPHAWVPIALLVACTGRTGIFFVERDGSSEMCGEGDCSDADRPADLDGDGDQCADLDGDGLCNVVGACVWAQDCDDGDPCTADTCVLSGGPGVCVSAPLDEDEDGFAPMACGGADCDDTTASVSPGQVEGPAGAALCSDSVDNDCDALTDSADPGCSGTADMTGISLTSGATPAEWRATALAARANGDFILAVTWRNESLTYGASLVEIDRFGTIVWQRAEELASPDFYSFGFSSLVPTRDGGLVAGGVVRTGANRYDAALIKLDPDLSTAFAFTFRDSVRWAVGVQVVQSVADDGFLIAVQSNYSTGSFMRVGATGTLLWSKDGSTLFSGGFGPASDGGAFVVDYRSGPTAVLRLSPTGDTVWAKEVPGTASAFHVANGIGYLSLVDGVSGHGTLLAVLNEDGDVLDTRRITLPGSEFTVYRIFADGSGNLILGAHTGSGSGYTAVAEVRTSDWRTIWCSEIGAGYNLHAVAAENSIGLLGTGGAVMRMDAQGWLWGSCAATTRRELRISSESPLTLTPSTKVLADWTASRTGWGLNPATQVTAAVEGCPP